MPKTKRHAPPSATNQGLIADGVPLGTYITETHDLRWNGPTDWRSVHGDAHVLWRLGLAHRMVGVPHAREKIDLRPSDPGSGMWCGRGHDGRWIHGTVALKPSSIEFTPADRVGRGYKWSKGSLAADVGLGDGWTELLADEWRARVAAKTLASATWTNISGRQARISRRQAADLVADARRLGEPSSLFLMEGPVEGDLDDVRTAVQHTISAARAAGWSADESARPERVGWALRILRTCEANPPALPPDWYADHVEAFDPEASAEDAGQRMRRAAFAGKASLPDWDLFWSYMAGAGE